MIIIGFGYKKRVGKDTALGYAMSFARQNFPDLRVEILSFGNCLKEIAYQMFKWGGLESAMYYENRPVEIEEIIPALGMSPRQIWDKVGLMGREIHPKVWVQMGITGVPDADVLISKDLRFPTEIELVDAYHGHKYRIDRDSAPKGGAVDQALNGYDGWTGVIDNNGTFRQFNEVVKRIIANHLNALVTPDKIVCPLCFARHRAVLMTAGEYTCNACHRGFNVAIDFKNPS